MTNNELILKRDSEITEFNNAHNQLEEKQKQINALQQETSVIANFLVEKRGRILILNELIGEDTTNDSNITENEE